MATSIPDMFHLPVSLIFVKCMFTTMWKDTDNLSKTLQKQSLSDAEGQHLEELTIKRYEK